MAQRRRADVLVIGAGLAGAVVTRRLSEAGVPVVCLEQGDWIPQYEYRGLERDWEISSLSRWSANPNVRRLRSDYPVVFAEGVGTPKMFNAVGGSTILYTAQWMRFMPSDFKVRTLDGVADDWPIEYQDLAPYYDQADREFEVSGLAGDPAYPSIPPPPTPALPVGPIGVRMARAMDCLGWHWWPGTSAITSAKVSGRGPCQILGACGQGCPTGAKATTDLTHWPPAIKRGARLITRARVRAIAVNSRGFATGAIYFDQERRERFQPADVVVMAASGLGTPRLLLLSTSRAFPDGLANRSGMVGRNYMRHTYSTVLGTFEDEDTMASWQGASGHAIYSMEFYESHPSRDFVRGAKWSLQPTGGPLAIALPTSRYAPVGAEWGPSTHHRVREAFGRSAVWGIMGEDLPDGSNHISVDPNVSDDDGIPAPRVSYRLSKNSMQMHEFHTARAVESFDAARATKILVRKLADSGSHWMGTARMGLDPERSVVDRYGRSHDVPNLYIADSSVFVTSAGVNPAATIAALALRTADEIIRTRRSQVTPL